MYVRLDNNIIKDYLCCPLCKGSLELKDTRFICKECASEYCRRDTAWGESVWDFRIHRPAYSIPAGSQNWAELQEEFEQFFDTVVKRDDLRFHLDAIDSVKEIYSEEFKIDGRILDVGGSMGTLRHYLNMNRVQTYISVDPHTGALDNLGSYPNMMKAYPCLSEPCNFLACSAEHLPFVKGVFDWVHMRSVLDHFEDPYLAIKEAYRVLSPDGQVLIGLTVYGGKSSLSDQTESVTNKITRKIQSEGIKGLLAAAWGRVGRVSTDHHMFRWNYEDLIDLLRVTRFSVTKEHWQKPPFTMCVYVAAQRS